jgi:hypothetical protein
MEVPMAGRKQTNFAWLTLAKACFLLIALSACRTDRGAGLTVGSVIFNGQRDFQVVTTSVTAQVTIGQILCLAQIGEHYPYADLMRQLHKKYPLSRNEMFVNLREDRTDRRVLVFFCSETYTLTADVVRFGPDSVPSADPVALPPPASSPQVRPPAAEIKLPEPTPREKPAVIPLLPPRADLVAQTACEAVRVVIADPEEIRLEGCGKTWSCTIGNNSAGAAVWQCRQH